MSKPISIQITGDAKNFTKAADKVEGKLGKIGEKAGKMGKLMGGAFLAGGAAAAGILLTVGQTFEEMENNIIKGTGASGEALEGLLDSAKDVMASVPDSGAIVSTALADVNTFFGSTGEELSGLTESFLDFSRLTGTEVADNIEGLDGVMTSFNLTTADADELMGDLIRTSQATGVPMEALIGTIDKYGPSFAAAGLSAEQAAIMVGEFNMAGLDAEGTGKILDKVLLDAASSGISAEEAMANLDAQLSAMTSEERLAAMEQMVGGRNASQAIAAWESGALSIDQINASVADGAGVLAEQTAATATLTDKWNEFKNKVLVKIEPLASKMFDGLEIAMDWMESDGIPIMESLGVKLKALWETHGPKVTAVFETVSTVVTGVMGVLRGLFSGSNDDANKLGGTISRVGGIFSTVFEAIRATVDRVTKIAMGLWSIFGETILSTVADLVEPLQEYFGGILSMIEGIFELITSVMTGDWKAAWAAIQKILDGAKTALLGALEAVWVLLKGSFNAAKTAVSSIWSKLWSGIKTAASNGATDAKNFVAGIPAKILLLGQSFLNAGKTVGGKILTGIKNGLTSAVGFAGDVASGVWTKVKNAVNTNVIDKINTNIPNSISLGFLGSIDLPDNPIPRLFKGTDNFDGGYAMVGEMGRELVQLPNGAKVMTNRETEAALAPQGGPTNISVSVESQADPFAIASEMAWALKMRGR